MAKRLRKVAQKLAAQTDELTGAANRRSILERADALLASCRERNLEAEIVPLLRELGIGLVSFSPLGRGFLAGNAQRAEDYPADDFRRHDPRYQGQNYDANMKAAKVVPDIAAARGFKAGQIAVAWLLHKGDDVVPIPGTKRRSYLEENIAAADIRLDAKEIVSLDAALAPDIVSGPRYGEKMMALVDRHA